MPFTPSHVAAVLPLTGRRTRRWLPPAALAIGAMVPDLPYFAPTPWGSNASHAWYGPLTVDLLAGMVLVAGWWLVLRPPWHDLAPRLLRVPPEPSRLPGSSWLTAVPAMIIVAVTHVVWDTFSVRGAGAPSTSAGWSSSTGRCSATSGFSTAAACSVGWRC